MNNTGLDGRKGLPSDLRVLVEKYPRRDWQRHRNLGGMAQFWLRRHDMFRDLGGMLNRGMLKYREGELSANQFTDWFFPRLNFFLQNLHGHHQIEDYHYFPVFREAEARLARGFDILDSDHHILHDALEANADSARSFLSLLDGDHDKLRFAADDYAVNTEYLVSLLTRHLEDEEDLIIPVILDRGEQELGIA